MHGALRNNRLFAALPCMTLVARTCGNRPHAVVLAYTHWSDVQPCTLAYTSLVNVAIIVQYVHTCNLFLVISRCSPWSRQKRWQWTKTARTCDTGTITLRTVRVPSFLALQDTVRICRDLSITINGQSMPRSRVLSSQWKRYRDCICSNSRRHLCLRNPESKIGPTAGGSSHNLIHSMIMFWIIWARGPQSNTYTDSYINVKQYKLWYVYCSKLIKNHILSL